MYTRVFISLMVILCIFGLIASSILYYGFDPTYYPALSVVMMSISLFLGLGSLMGLMILGVKKILRRGYIYPMDAFRSFRHGLLFILLVLGLFLVYIYGSFNFLTSFLLICIVFLLELILTKMEDS